MALWHSVPGPNRHSREAGERENGREKKRKGRGRGEGKDRERLQRPPNDRRSGSTLPPSFPPPPSSLSFPLPLPLPLLISFSFRLSQSITGTEFPSELVEDSKFVPLSADDPVYGPPALLLLGFEADEMDRIKKFLRELDGEFLKVIYCTEDMIKLSVWDAMHIEQPDLEDVKIAKSLPRICFLSGLSGEEMMMFIDAFPETGLKPAVFAALVPNSADKLLGDVIEEIMGDHEMLSGKPSS